MSNHLDDPQISRLLDSDLPLVERAAALTHLSNCPTCARRQAELVEVAATLRSHPTVAWTPNNTARVVAKLHTPTTNVRSRRASLVAPVLILAAALLTLAAGLAAPIGPQVASSVLDVFTWLSLRLASSRQIVMALLAVVVIAPALVYPLARWR